MSANSLTGLEIGQTLEFTSFSHGAEGLVASECSEEIQGLAGGGFRGEVIVLPDSVLKTGITTPTKEFLRELNGAIPDFHPASSSLYASLDHISTRALFTVVTAVGEGDITMPEPLGFVDLGPSGFAQHIERVNGRIASFMDEGEENRKIDSARHFIWEVIGKQFGFEHSAQVHPKNPYGRPNLWIGENGKVIWLDFLAAFPLKGRALPNPKKYEFHKDAQNIFGHERPMDRINIEMFRVALRDYRSLFSDEQLQELDLLLTIYEAIGADLNTEKEARTSKKSVSRNIAQISKSGVRAGTHSVMSLVPAVITDSSARESARQFFTNGEVARRTILSKTLLSGVTSANKHGLVSREDYERSLGFLSPRDARLFTTMQLGFFATSRIADVASIPFYAAAATSENPGRNAFLTLMVHQMGPNILRGLSTLLVGRRTGKNLNKMALQSCIPAVGTYLSIPMQITREYGEHADMIKHYGRRSLTARLSKFSPSGGWGSDAELVMWNGAKRKTASAHSLIRRIGATANLLQNRNQDSLDLLGVV